MSRLTDEELIIELQERFSASKRVIAELKELTGKLEATNRRLQDSEDMRGHFLANIRNEINNPLTAIMGLAAQLARGDVSPELAATNGRFIYDESFELNFQLENVFTAAGLEAASEVPLYSTLDLAALIADVVKEFDHRRQAKEVTVEPAFAGELPFVADPRFLRIILRNLVANALEYSPSGGKVIIRAAAGEEGLRVEIRDNGPGIDVTHHATVFDRFRQLDRGWCKSHRGLGLGLSVSRALAELCGGMIGLDSAPGKGSLFFLTLPATASRASDATSSGLLFGDTFEKF